MRKFKNLSWLVVLSVFMSTFLLGCGTSAPKKEIFISAAASLKDSLTEVQTAYQKKYPNITLTINYGGSGTLQQQIEQGAPADLFISAAKTQIDALDAKNLIIKTSKVDLLGNDLVLVVGKDNTTITSIEDLAKSTVSKVSIGTPESVPAGKYAQQALTKLNLWDTLQSKLVLTKDVTTVLSYVEAGNADAGFVYTSDAKGSAKVKIVVTAPADSHTAIVYPATILTATKNQKEAQDFLTYLQGADAQKIFTNYGFKSVK